MAAYESFRAGEALHVLRAHLPVLPSLTEVVTIGGTALAGVGSVAGVTAAKQAFDERVQSDLQALAPHVAATAKAGHQLSGIVRDSCVTIPRYFSEAPKSSELMRLRHDPKQGTRRVVRMHEARAAKQGGRFATHTGRLAVTRALRQTSQATRNIQLPYSPDSTNARIVQQSYAAYLAANLLEAAQTKASATKQVFTTFGEKRTEMLQGFASTPLSYAWHEGHGLFEARAALVGLDPTLGRPLTPTGRQTPLTLSEAIMGLPKDAVGDCPRGF